VLLVCTKENKENTGKKTYKKNLFDMERLTEKEVKDN